MIWAFAEHVSSHPWQWLPQMVDEWNIAVRVQSSESDPRKCALTVDEL
ncbi:hypothetical protein [Salinispora arenicola]|nr:hypothetical protein [Salinispora arenicola]